MKETNPKDAVGTKKCPFSTVSAAVIAEMGCAMLEGDRKYGRHNYRVAGVRASVYYDAAMRHLMQWWEGEDIDTDSNMNHVTKALSCLSVLRDAMINDMMTDDRPPKLRNGWMNILNAKASDIIDKYPNAKLAFTQIEHNKDNVN